jgi:CheY-like chemotaxis protein
VRDAATDPAEFLIVDDTESNLRLASYLIEKMGHRAHIARDSRQALELARRHACDYALIDLHMPVVNGPALARTLRAEHTTRHMRLILFTSHVTQAELEAAWQSGFSGMLDKPYDPVMFVAGISRLLQERARSSPGGSSPAGRRTPPAPPSA